MEENRRGEDRKLSKKEEVDLAGLFRDISSNWKQIAIFTVVVSILTLVVCFIVTPVYRSTAVILPINKTLPPMFEGSDLSSLIGILGIGGGSSSSKIMAILESNTIRERILNKHDLMKIIFEDDWDDRQGRWRDEVPNIWEGIRAMEDMVEIKEDRKTSAISISSDFKDPQVARDISNWFVDELSLILNEKSFSMARHYRENIEGILSSFGGHLKLPPGELPDFTIFMQKMRDLAISEKAYEELLIQYYLAKFQEAKEDVVFQVIDEAKPPDKPVKPKKKLYTAIAFIMSLFIGSFYVYKRKGKMMTNNTIDLAFIQSKFLNLFGKKRGGRNRG